MTDVPEAHSIGLLSLAGASASAATLPRRP
jgi:hypothetical protein